MTQWVVRFSPAQETVDLYQIADSALVHKGNMTIQAVSEKVMTDSVCVFIPTEYVVFVDVELPPVKSKTLKKIIETLVEDHVSNPVADNSCLLPMHYAFNQPTTVAVIEKKMLKTYSDLIETAGWVVDRVEPDCFLLPKPGEIAPNLFYAADRAIVRESDKKGFAVLKSNLVHFLPEAEGIEPCELQLSASPVFNCLQGLNQKRKQSKVEKGLWYWMSLGALGMLVIHFILIAYVNTRMAGQLEQVQAENLQLYQRIFPQAKRVVSPRTLIQEELALLGPGSDEPFFQLLSPLSLALAQTTDIKLEKIQYQHNYFHVHVDAASFTTLSDFISHLEDLGVEVKQESATQQGVRVEAQYTLQSR